MKWIVTIILLVLSSCGVHKQIVEVPVEDTRIEYKYKIERDSIYVHDSIDKYLRGDTVFVYKESIRFKYSTLVDTICTTDTITKVVPIEVIKEVEVNHIKWYQKILMWIGGIVSLILTGYIICKVRLK